MRTIGKNLFSWGERGFIASHFASDRNALDLIQRDFVGCAVIELGGAGRLMGRDCLSIFDRTAIFQVSGNPGRSKRVAAGGIGKTRSYCPTLDHL